MAQEEDAAAEYDVSEPHETIVLDPPQECPSGHALHDVLVPVVPPLVYEPAAHITHEVERLEMEYCLSLPQSSHVTAPGAAYFPAAQTVTVCVPSQASPSRQSVHEVRVFLSFPDVKLPSPQVRHCCCPAAL